MARNKFWLVWAIVIYMFLIAYSYFYLDLPIAKFFRVYEDTSFENTLSILTISGESHWYLIGGLFIYFYYKNKDKKKSTAGMFIFLTVVLSGIISGVMKVTLGRFRPVKFFRENLYGFDGWHWNEYKFNSFPSGHTTTAFSVGIAFALMYPKYSVQFIFFGFFIAFTRIATTVHYLSDTMLGALIGSFTSIYLYKNYLKKSNVW